MTGVRNFKDDLAAERKDTLRPEVRDLLRSLFPQATGMRVERRPAAQKVGVDVAVNVERGPPVTIDIKFRERDYDDIALEYAHAKDDGGIMVGWVADESKKCDLFAYIFKTTWTCYLLPRPALQRAWRERSGEWLAQYRHPQYHRTRNKTYWTKWCPVPTDVVMQHVGGIRIATLEGASIPQRSDFFEHYCHCGHWGSFGSGVAIRGGKEGHWRCRDHR